MKKTKRMTFAAIMAAVAAAVMLVSWFPYLTYAIPALAGLFVMATVIETNVKYAIGTYLASAFPIFLWAEKESMILYIMFFGYYPIVKALTEKLRKPVLEWIIKIGVFNLAVVSAYFLFSKAIGFSLKEFEIIGKYGAYIFLAAANVVFVLYDIAVSRMAMFYFVAIKPKFKGL